MWTLRIAIIIFKKYIYGLSYTSEPYNLLLFFPVEFISYHAFIKISISTIYTVLFLSIQFPPSLISHQMAPATDHSGYVFMQKRFIVNCHSQAGHEKACFFRHTNLRETPHHSFVHTSDCLSLLMLNILHIRGVRTSAV